MKIKLWVTKDCKVCHEIRSYLDDLRILYDVTHIDDLEEVDGNLDVMAQLCDQNMEVPVCEVDGDFVLPNEFISTMKGMM
jgi:glutaredoxin